MNLERLKSEAKEIEEMMYPSENPSEEAPTVETDTGLEQESTAEVITPVETEEVSEAEKKKRTSWKQRYSTYKATTDATIYQLRQGESSLKQKIAELSKVVGELQDVKATEVDLFAGVITEDDEDLIGTEAVGIMKKATEAANKPLLEEIKRLKAERLADTQRQADSAKATSTAELRNRLSNLVENFETIDISQGFSNFLDEVDPHSGYQLKRLYSNAVSSGDIYRVADFYKKYSESLPPSKESILEEKVAPTGQGGSAVNTGESTKKQVYSVAEYVKASTDYTKKNWRNNNEKQQLIEKMAMLEQAYSEGRVL